jgi:hypothetical protein
LVRLARLGEIGYGYFMLSASEIADAMHDLPVRTKAALAVELIDSLGEEAWSEETLAMLVEDRDSELESGAEKAVSYEEFMAGLRRPADA